MGRESKEDKRKKSMDNDSEDVFTRLGDNAAKVLQGYIEKIEKKKRSQDAIGDEIKEIKAMARKDGFDSRAVDKVLAKRKMKDSVRIQLDESVKKMERALGMPDLFEYEKNKDKYDQSEKDADEMAA